jgi:ketosteroid isomerase-like protein
MLPEKVKEAVAKALVVWNTGDVDLLDDVYAPDVTYHQPPFPDLDLAGLKEDIIATRTAFPDLRLTEDSRFMRGDLTCGRHTIRGTFTGPSPRLGRPNGRSFFVRSVTITRFEGDKAVEIWHFMDQLGTLQQLGLVSALDRLEEAEETFAASGNWAP